MKQTIKGVLAMKNGEVRFLSGWFKGMFENGIIDEYIFIKEHEFEYELPADFDPIKPQIAALDAKEKEEKFQHAQKLKAIQGKRQELLAIGND